MNFNNIPPVTMRLIIINVLVFVFTGFIAPHLQEFFALWYFQSEGFQAYQLATHMFTHGGFTHILFNMYGVFLFGSMLERIWGAKRYLIFYFVSALGAVILHQAVDYFQIQAMLSDLSPDVIQTVQENGYELIRSGRNYTDELAGAYNGTLNSRMVGASGALFGLLVGFAMYFPNTELMLIFLPVPIKAKYFVMMYAAVELFMGINQSSGDNIAHFAHLGGALFGFILIQVWRRDRSSFY
jgi:membrane associated rhomboid family serine protease